MKKRQMIIIASTQIFLFFMVILVILHFNHRLNIISYADRHESESGLTPELTRLLGDYLIDFDRLHTSRQEPASQNYHQLIIPMKKNWAITIWRNDQPVLAEWADNDEFISYSIPLEYGDNLIRVLVLDQAQTVVYRDQLGVSFRNSMVELLRNSIERGNVNQKHIAVTFDAGSDDAFSREILSILAGNDIHCTLFLTGQFMERYPDLVKEMLQQGHEIANHTYNHPHLTSYEEDRQHRILPGVTREFIQSQLLRTDSIFYLISGEHLKPFWRAPFGEYNAQILTWAAETGYLHVHWTGSFDTHDWVTDESSQLYRTPDEIYDHIMRVESELPHGLNGVIMLMHMGSHRTRDHMFEVLPRLISAVRQKGYALGRISEILN